MRTAGTVDVIHGANCDEYGIAGAQVGAVRRNLSDAFNLRHGQAAFVNGKHVDDSFLLRAGDILEFCLRRGRKALNRMFTEGEIRELYTGVPVDVLNDFFASYPHADCNSAGLRIWTEISVDQWIQSRYCCRTYDDGRDKVMWPDRVRLAGKIYDLPTGLAPRLFEVLIKHRDSANQAVEKEIVLDEVFPYNEDSENALKCLISRTNDALTDQRCPWSIRNLRGYIVLRQ